MFKDTTIRKRVMAVVEKVIEKAQEDYQIMLDTSIKNHQSAVADLIAKHEQEKNELAEEAVQKILGKIL